MKRLIIILCACLFIFGCKKTSVNPYQSEGIITGYDTRACPVCGGLEIIIKNDTTKNAPPFYDVNSSLQQLGINENSTFPINVSLNWTRATGVGNYIVISKIKVD